MVSFVVLCAEEKKKTDTDFKDLFDVYLSFSLLLPLASGDLGLDH